MTWDALAAVLVAVGPPAKGEALKLFVGALRAVVPTPPVLVAESSEDDEPLDLRSGRQFLRWCVRHNPIAGLLVADLDEEQMSTVVRVLDGMLKERSGAA